jgi:hypothetical protein
MAGERIGAELLRPEVLDGAFDDLLGAGDHMDARRQARRLEALIDAQGLDTISLIKEIREIIEDDLVRIKAARGEKLESGDLGRTAGLGPAERVELARLRMRVRPRRARAMVWLEYTLARLGPGRVVMGDAVQLYTARWLREAIAAGRVGELPAELLPPGPTSNLSMLIDLGGGDEEGRGMEIPEALVRIDLGEVATDQALQMAREAAELIVALAVLQGSDPVLWQPTGSFVRFLDGREAGATFHASPVPALTLDHHDALRSDAMPEFSAGLGADLATHLPVRNARLRRAARLALWLRRSREAWEPGRVVLVGRVLEQVAGWAGVRDRYRFEDEYLRLSWAIRRVRLEVSNSWRGVWAARIDRDPALHDGAWEEIVADPTIDYEEAPSGGYSFSLAGVMERTDFLIERLEPGSAPHERLSRLARRTAEGKSTAAWIAELEEEFAVLKSRGQRTRNALVHGGRSTTRSPAQYCTSSTGSPPTPFTRRSRGFSEERIWSTTSSNSAPHGRPVASGCCVMNRRVPRSSGKGADPGRGDRVHGTPWRCLADRERRATRAEANGSAPDGLDRDHRLDR